MEQSKSNSTSKEIQAYRTYITSAAKAIRDLLNDQSQSTSKGSQDEQIEREVDEIIAFEIKLAKVTFCIKPTSNN